MKLQARKVLGIGLLAAVAIALIACARRCLRSMSRRRAQEARVAVCQDGLVEQLSEPPEGHDRRRASNPRAA